MDTNVNTDYPKLPEGIKVAMGGSKSSNIAHFYASESEYERGTCLCGRTVIPRIDMEHWDLSHELIQAATCPDCLTRLKLYKFMKKTEDGGVYHQK